MQSIPPQFSLDLANPYRLPSLASQTDKHRVYELAVQSAEADVDIIQGIYHFYSSRKALRFREDFCGTALTLCHWVTQGEAFTGEGLDNDPDPLEWGRVHNQAELGDAGSRVSLRLGDVCLPSLRPPDVRCAFNFSYWAFLKRQQMLNYLQCAQRDLAKGGVLILDITGGSESLNEDPYETVLDDLTVIWQQQNFSPIDHIAELTLRFRFADGSEIDPPYQYKWRVWSIPEMLELLDIAGFSKVDVWWQIDDEKGFGYQIEHKGHNDPCWVACIAALK